jgi:hypothetical protein
MFIAHTDTVHQKVDKIIVKEENLIRPNTFGKQFNNKMVPCLKAYTEDGKPTGKKEIKDRPVFNSRVHGGTEKDIVDEYSTTNDYWHWLPNYIYFE